MQNLYLIDGYAQFFRAYHAIRTPMSSPVTGEPTNLTFGFVGMLLKILQHNAANLTGDGVPTHLAVALDIGGDHGTFRSQLFPDYKANRDAPPEDLKPQVERCLKLLDAIGVPVIGAEGFEADDVIATLATEFSAKHPDTRIRIISKDKDLKQLLGSGTPPTEMYDVHTDVLITAETMHADLGLRPDQIIDMLALMGDTADNVPGVPGIGAKTAAALLQEFDTLDAILAEATDESKPKKDWVIKGKRRENLAASVELLKLSKELVSLRHDTPVELDLASAQVSGLQLDALMPILKELGFNRYQDELARMLGHAPASPKGTAKNSAAETSTPKKRAKAEPDHGDFGGLFVQSEPALPEPDGDYHTITTKKALQALAKRIAKAKLIAIDTETTALNPRKAKLAGVSIAIEPGEAFYIPTLCPADESCLDQDTVLAELRSTLESDAVLKVGHNIKYDLVVFRGCGVRLAGLVPPADSSLPAGDTMIASYLLDASRSSHSMDALALAELGRENISIKQLLGTGKNQRTFDQVPLTLAGPYAAEDADVTLQLAHKLIPRLKEHELNTLYRELEAPLVEVLAELEFNGIEVNPDELDTQRERLQTRIDELLKQITDEAEDTLARTFDPNSPKQLGAVLFNSPEDNEPGLGLKPIKKTKTGFSTDAEVLEKLAQDPAVETPIPTLMLEYRQLTKLVNTYLVNLKDEINAETGRIHASFNQTVAATGRLSSSDPNLQNIPIRTDLGREIRRAFVAPAGRTLITADYSQIELRLLAHLSKDPALTAAFHADEDIHAAVAAQIHNVKLADVTKEQRSGAKMVNFGIVYGVTPFGLARRLGVSNTEATEIIDGYKAKFVGITSFLAECVEYAKSHGYVATMLGRRRPILEIDSNNPNRRALAERMAINSVVQGSAADLIKIAMVDLHRRLMASNPASFDSGSLSPTGGEGRGEGAAASPALADVLMLLQIHDELVFEAPEASAVAAQEHIVERMEAAMDLSVPLKADGGISSNWFEAK